MLLRRALLLTVAIVATVALLAGLARLGVPIPVAGARVQSHGPLFVLGVFFPLIALERAVAFGKPSGYVVPVLGLLAGLGLVADISALERVAAPAAVALVLLNVSLWRKQPSAHLVLMSVGSVALALSSVAWAFGASVPDVVLCWMAFFVLTIVAERIELARFASPPKGALQALLVSGFALAALSSLGMGRDAFYPRAQGSVLAFVGLWLWRYDLARRTIRQRGLPRYAALAALLGASWLVCSGVLLAACGLPKAGFLYDAILHGVFVGFVLSMVFGHAPIIFPAVTRSRLPFHPLLYVPLVTLHGGLVMRLSGDLFGLPLLRQVGGATNALALSIFPLCAVWARRRSLTGHDSDHALGVQ
jgi:nitrite reductase (NO-forming)